MSEGLAAVKARHAEEMSELQARFKEAKKAAKKNGKKKLMEVDAQFTQAEMDLAAQQRDELEAAEENDETETVVEPEPVMDEASRKTSLAAKKRAKAAKKRADMRAREREAEARVAEEKTEAAKVSERTVELKALEAKLSPMGLGLFEVAADGNCLFRAVQHQLKQQNKSTDHARLRTDTADYMRSHADDFLAFFVSENEQVSPSEAFEAHCATLRDTSEWGGQPEILALSRLLDRPIWVHSRDAPTLKMGDDAEEGKKKPLQLTFHRHYFALGEHYNSVVATAKNHDDDH